MARAIVASCALGAQFFDPQLETRNGHLLWLQITLNIGQFERSGFLKARG